MMNVYMGTDVEDFIFGESTSYEAEEINNVTDEEMNAEGVIECFDDPDVACYRIALENEQNHNAIMLAFAEQEITSLEEGVKDTLADGKAKAKQFLGWVKKQIQKFWAKVKGVFKKVMDTLASFVLSNKAFIKKYRPYASQMKKPKNKKEFEGHEFGNLTINYEKVADLLKGKKSEIMRTAKNADAIAVSKDAGDRRSFINALGNEIRTIICSTTTTAESFDENLRTKLYGGTKVKKLSIKEFAHYLNELESTADTKKDAKDGYKEAEKSIKKLLSTVKEVESELNEKGKEDAAKAARMMGEAINGGLSIMSTALSYQTRAIVAKAQQDRKIANWYVTGQSSVKESAEIDVEDIVLI